MGIGEDLLPGDQSPYTRISMSLSWHVLDHEDLRRLGLFMRVISRLCIIGK